MVFRRLFKGRAAIDPDLAPPVGSPQVEPPTQSWPFAKLAKAVAALEKAEAALRVREWDKAERHLEDVGQDPPDRATYLILLAMVSIGRQDWSEVERRWQAVIDEFPDRLDAYNGRATAIRMQGRIDESIGAYLFAMEQAPMDLGPPSMLAHMLENLPAAQVAELSPLLKVALDRHLDDQRQQPLVYWSKGKVALAAGELTEAVQHLRVAQAAAINNLAIRNELEIAEARLAAAPMPDPSVA
ncbi:tetratricopeptide repeat protein [Lichenicola sp.]|uniref:tetratricopeptide repeat protein n=1 Tax=Lichenicola sp. TaxID=2804529 RepID=UPI003B005D09